MAIDLIAKAVAETQLNPDGEGIIKYWNTLSKYPAISATTPSRRPSITAI